MKINIQGKDENGEDCEMPFDVSAIDPQELPEELVTAWIFLSPKKQFEGLLDAHVIPYQDLREHEASEDCWCEPEEDVESESTLWIHSAFDNRDLYETGERLPH